MSGEKKVTVDVGVGIVTPEMGRCKVDGPKTSPGTPLCGGRGKEEGCPIHGGDCPDPICSQ
ncbi:MAG TPA: hypothetical protein PKA31_00020 [Candidatus Moranbacteria bacterium]|nr:hypothetical protein [Candidatus Moranbacteria bacterium]